MITSAGNARVKQVVQWQNKAKERKKDGIFLAEGIKMFEEAPLDSIVEVFISESLEQKADAFYKKKLLQLQFLLLHPIKRLFQQFQQYQPLCK